MTERESFVQAIREAPDDFALRLVFADWLEEHDDPLGPFIRLQAELEPIRLEIENPRATELIAAERKALSRHRRKWLGEVYKWTQDRSAPMRVSVRRGFVEEVALSAANFLERGEKLYRKCPGLFEVVLHDVRGRAVADLAASPLLAPVRRLVLADWLNPPNARRLANSPHLASVKSLTLWLGNNDQREVLRAFATSSRLPSLREVRLVQLYGGVQAGKGGPALAARADELAAEFNALRGQPVASVHRPFASRFPLDGDVGYGLLAGHLPGRRPALALPGEKHMVLVLFDDDGAFAELRCVKPACDQDDLEGRLRDGFGLEPGLIRVREFATRPRVAARRRPWFYDSSRRPKDEDVAVCLWSYYDVRVVEDPDTHPDWTSVKRRGVTVRSLHTWMDDGDFMIDCGNDYWAGCEGKITAS
jgi:uncharacterized protein (TIGR02996 family)